MFTLPPHVAFPLATIVLQSVLASIAYVTYRGFHERTMKQNTVNAVKALFDYADNNPHAFEYMSKAYEGVSVDLDALYKDKERHDSVCRLLSQCEQLSVGAMAGLYNKQLIMRSCGYQLIKLRRYLNDFIEERRSTTGNTYQYGEFSKLCKELEQYHYIIPKQQCDIRPIGGNIAIS